MLGCVERVQFNSQVVSEAHREAIVSDMVGMTRNGVSFCWTKGMHDLTDPRVVAALERQMARTLKVLVVSDALESDSADDRSARSAAEQTGVFTHIVGIPASTSPLLDNGIAAGAEATDE
jgi:hypothetical protein